LPSAVGDRCLDPGELGVDCREPRGPAGLLGELRARRGLALDGSPIVLLDSGAQPLRLAEASFRQLELGRRRGAGVGDAHQLTVELVESNARGAAALDPLVPSGSAPVALAPKVTQPRGGQLDRILLGLRGELLVA